jgi:hypothetical protein
MTDCDERLRDELLQLVDQAPASSAEEAIAHASDGRHLRSASAFRPPSWSRSRSVVVLRAAAVICLVGGLAAILAVRLTAGPKAMKPVPRERPAPITVNGALLATSCPSPTFCMAVGSTASKAGAGLSERWNGSNWAPVVTPNPPRATEVTLTSVSCASSSSCVALGSAELVGKRRSSFGVSWDGTSWQLESFPAPAAEAILFSASLM